MVGDQGYERQDEHLASNRVLDSPWRILNGYCRVSSSGRYRSPATGIDIGVRNFDRSNGLGVAQANPQQAREEVGRKLLCNFQKLW